MSSHVHSLKAGDKITVIGPKGKITYHGHGELHFYFELVGNTDPDIVSKHFFLENRIIPEHPAGRPTTDDCA